MKVHTPEVLAFMAIVVILAYSVSALQTAGAVSFTDTPEGLGMLLLILAVAFWAGSVFGRSWAAIRAQRIASKRAKLTFTSGAASDAHTRRRYGPAPEGATADRIVREYQSGRPGYDTDHVMPALEPIGADGSPAQQN